MWSSKQAERAEFSTNNAGMSLVEIMIALGILSVLMLAISQATMTALRSDKQIQDNLHIRDLSDIIKNIVFTERCGINDLDGEGLDVTDQGWSADTKYSLTGGLSNNAISISETNTYMNRVHIDTIRLSPYYNPINGESAYIALDQSDPTDLANAEMIQASLRVAIKVPSGLIRKDVIMPIILKLNKEKTKIIDCNSLEGSVNMAAICTSMGGDWDYEALNCSQPCPPNMIKSEGVCVKKDHEDDKNVVIHCKAADACVVSDLYKSP